MTNFWGWLTSAEVGFWIMVILFWVMFVYSLVQKFRTDTLIANLQDKVSNQAFYNDGIKDMWIEAAAKAAMYEARGTTVGPG